MANKVVEVDGKRYMKVQKGKYFNKKHTRKYKRHHIVRNTLIITASVVIVAPIAFLFGAFFVPKKTDLADTYGEFETNLSNTIATSLNNLTTDGKFTMTLDNNFINSSLAYLKKGFIESTAANQFIDNIYCDIDGNNYTFNLDAHAAFFQTRVSLVTYLNIDDDKLTFKINEVLLGRLPLGNLAKSILPRFLTEDSINQTLHNAGFDATFSLNDLSIVYPRENFQTNIGTILDNFHLTDTNTPMGSLGSLILSLYNDIKETPSFKDGFTFTLNFSKLAEQKVTPNNPLRDETGTKTYLESYKSKVEFVEKCLKNGIVSTKTTIDGETSKGCDTLLKYLIDGYDTKYDDLFKDNQKLQDEIKNEYSKDYKSYVGLLKNGSPSVYMDGICSDIVKELQNPSDRYKTDSSIISGLDAANKLSAFISTSGSSIEFGKIGDNLLSDYLRYIILPSFNFCFPIKIGDSYKLPTIIFHDFSCNINARETLDLIGDLYIEGFKIPLTITNEISIVEGSNRKVSIKPTSFYIGGKSLTNIETVFKFLGKSFPSTGSLFTFDSTNSQFVFDFTQLQVDVSAAGITELQKTSIQNLIKGTGPIQFEESGASIDAANTILSVETSAAGEGTKGRINFVINRTN